MDLKFGYWTRVAWCCWLALLGLAMYPWVQYLWFGDLWFGANTSGILRTEGSKMLFAFAGIGLVYGAVGQSFWIVSGLRNAIKRCVGCILVIVAGAFLLSLLSVQLRESSLSTLPSEFVRLVAQLGGMVIAQSILFFLLGIVSWQSESVIRERPRRQYEILDIGFLTLATGVVLSITVRQSTPIRVSDFWTIAVGMWIVFPAIAATAAYSTIAPTWIKRLAAVSLVVCFAVGSCVGLASLEIRYARFQEKDFVMLLNCYGAILATFCGCCLLFPFAGVLDRYRQQEPVIPDEPSTPNRSSIQAYRPDG